MSERRFTMRLESGKAVLDPRYMAGSTADIVEHLAKLEEERAEIKKETAREIFMDIVKDFFEWDEEGFQKYFIESIKEKYGVEVKE